MRYLILCFLVGSVLTGCAETDHMVARSMAGLDCRPEVLQANKGNCVPVQKKGPKDAPPPGCRCSSLVMLLVWPSIVSCLN